MCEVGGGVCEMCHVGGYVMWGGVPDGMWGGMWDMCEVCHVGCV